MFDVKISVTMDSISDGFKSAAHEIAQAIYIAIGGLLLSILSAWVQKYQDQVNSKEHLVQRKKQNDLLEENVKLKKQQSEKSNSPSSASS